MDNKKLLISFADYSIPDFKEGYNSYKWVYYGTDNFYPDYLLSLYRRSPKHGAIVRNKASYVIGKGFKFVEEGKDEEVLKSVNAAGESLDKLGKKVAIDLANYGGFYLSVVWDRAKRIKEISHVDFHKVRSDKDNKIFYVKPRGWKDTSREYNKEVEYKAFDPNAPKGTQILYFKEYTPGLDVYTLPEYIQGLNYIEADALVSEHVLQNAKTGFTPSKMIVMKNGEPTEEQKKDIEKAILKKYTGVPGNKIILAFVDDPNKAPEVLDLGASDLTKEDFEQVDNLIQQNIFAVHNITSPMLFGIRVSGQLGGRSEMIEAYELFKSIYADEKQSAIEEVFNMLGGYAGWGGEIRIVQKEPIGLDLFGNNKLFELLPKSFVYEKMGIKPEDYPELEQEQQKKEDEKAAELEAKKAQSQQFQAAQEDILIAQFSECGSPKSDFHIIRRKDNILLSSDEVAGALELAFSGELSQQEANVIDLVSKDKRITPEALAEALKVPVPYVERLLDGLEEKGLLKSKTEKVGDDKQIIREVTKETPKVLQEKKPVTTQIFVKYSYEGPKDDRNRDFCHRMLNLDRLYSRAEIEQISQRVGYSVWERRGGFYHNPNTDETTPYCRHKWVQNIVIKKN